MTPPQPRKVGEVGGCPFCGEPPFIGPLDPKTEGDAWTEIRCQNSSCHVVAGVECYGESDHRDRAIAAWNTRADLAPLLAELEALRVDAERYRWLRSQAAFSSWLGAVKVHVDLDFALPDSLEQCRTEFDAAIDAALALRDKGSGE